MEALRQILIDIIDERLYESEMVPWAKRDRQFYFKRSQIVVFDTKKRIKDPRMLADVVPSMSLGSIFYHFIDAHGRTPEGIDDFSAWLNGFGNRYTALCKEIAAIDPYFTTLYEVRERLGQLMTTYLGSDDQ